MSTNQFGTAFAQAGFSPDPNISPNNQTFSNAVLAVVNRNHAAGGGTGSVTGVDASVAGPGTSAGTFSGGPITTSGTLVLTLNTFNGTLAGLVPSSAGGTLNFLRADGSFAAPAGGGTSTGSVTSVAGTSVGTGSSALVITGSPITTSGTFTYSLKVFDGTNMGVVPASAGGATNFLRADGSFAVPGGTNTNTGSVTAVSAVDNSTAPIFGFSGIPVTTSGTITGTLIAQAKNLVFAGPTSGANAQPTFRALTGTDLPSGLGCLITVYTNATLTSTHTFNSGSVLCDVIVIAGGGGGGGGAGLTAGGAAGGGGGGGAGGWSSARYSPASLGSTVAVTFSGTRATGGFGGTGNGNGTAGGAGANGQFGTFLAAYGGTKGAGATSSGGSLGAAGVGKENNGSGGGSGATGNGGNASNLSNSAFSNTNFGATGGGGGGGVNAAGSTIGIGGTGGGAGIGAGPLGFITVVGGISGTLTGGAGGAGNSSIGGWETPATGGGGGAGAAGAVPGGAGGQGGDYGAGGGGGGGAQATGNGGPGGAGGLAAVVVFEWGNGVSGIAPGNVSNLVSTTGTNGVSVNYMRADAAPAIDQAMSPTWTGRHTFNAAEPQIIIGTSTGYAWVTGTHYPVAQFAGIGGIFGTATTGLVLSAGGLYWNGTNYIYGQAGTGVIASLGTGSFTVSCVNTSGTSGGVATPTVVFSIGGTVTSNKIQGYGPTNAALTDMTPDKGVFNGTCNGFTAAVTAVCTWNKMGNLVALLVGTCTGSSNATTFTITNIPAAITPVVNQDVILASTKDNTTTFTMSLGQMQTGGTLALFLGTGGAGWTAGGGKGIPGASVITYMLNN